MGEGGKLSLLRAVSDFEVGDEKTPLKYPLSRRKAWISWLFIPPSPTRASPR